jgi:hypothetical protein
MLKKIAPVLLAAISLLTACDKYTNSKCGDKICDLSFASLRIMFVDKDNKGVFLKKNSYSAVNQRTNDTIKITTTNPQALVVVGSYPVVNDNYTQKLSEAGDDIKVTGTDSLTNQTKSAIITVAGGECACHIKKLSGPDKIQFD